MLALTIDRPAVPMSEPVVDGSLAGLVQRLQAGDATALEPFVEATQDTAFRVARSVLRDPHLCEDAVQDAYVVVYREIRHLRDPRAFRAWFGRIVVNRCRYDVFATTLAGAHAILSDSGGIQEEAPSLGKRVLVARESTERPEGVASGHNVIVGRERSRILKALLGAWKESPYRGPLPCDNPYGDGQAAKRIANILVKDLAALESHDD